MSKQSISSNSPIRINKYICGCGICSRKAADVYVKRGIVYINGDRAMLGDKVTNGDKVTVEGRLIAPIPANDVLVIALNKPVGVVCTATKNDTRNIVDFVAHSSRIVPVGRLDKDSQGLILLTNKVNLIDKILRSDNHHEKEYVVTVNKEINNDFITAMSEGVPILGVVTRKCSVVKESRYVFRIILIQGLNRQIRRMCKYFDYDVVKLVRTRVMHITLNGLPVGQWRELSKKELAELADH